VQRRPETQVLADRQRGLDRILVADIGEAGAVGPGIVRDVFAVDGDSTVQRLQKAGEEADQAGLAASVRPGQQQGVASLQGKR
jgi:hypothetical protein